jgi:hypothetical protein
MLDDSAAAVGDTMHVDIELPGPLLGRTGMERASDGDASAVDGQIKATRGCHCGIDDRAYRIGIPDVAGRSGHACTITG